MQQENHPATSGEPIDRFRLIFDTTFQFIGLLDSAGLMLEVNRPALVWAQASRDDVIGKLVWETPWWVHAGDAILHQLRQAVKTAGQGEFVRYDVTLPAPHGGAHTFDFSLTPIIDDAHRVTYLIAEGRDVTEQRRLQIALHEANENLRTAQEQARQLAITDALTGLHNRRGFFNLAEHHRALGARAGTKAFLMIADIDGMKRTNDRFGHEAGDTLIRLAAKALTTTLRSSDLIARLGGDEFAALGSASSLGSGAQIAERIAAQVDALNRDAALPIPLRLSVGVHEFDWSDNFHLEALIAIADSSMYEQKRSRQK